ncbi:MAG: hypothetical protein ACTSU5_02390 [Promethearchaeota archaeon]
MEMFKKKVWISSGFSAVVSLVVLVGIGVPSGSLVGLWAFVLAYSTGFFVASLVVVGGLTGLKEEHPNEELGRVFRTIAKKDLTAPFFVSIVTWVFFVYDDSLAIFFGTSFRPGAGVSSPYPIWAGMTVLFVVTTLLAHVLWTYSKFRGRMVMAGVFVVSVVAVSLFLIFPGDFEIFERLDYGNWFWFHLLSAPMLFPVGFHWILRPKDARLHWLVTGFVVANAVIVQLAYAQLGLA